jgi:thiol-disulfide isomerase/thioredoxin/ASC-1-like (ASCH) protein
MKKNLSFIFLAYLLLMMFNCKQENSIKDIRILLSLDSAERDSDAIVSVFSIINLEEIEVTKTKVDSLGNGFLEFIVNEPTLAKLKIGKKRIEVYLEPGYDLRASIAEGKAVNFSGIGSDINNYLAKISLLKKNVENSGGKNISELDQEKFLLRIDSLEKSLLSFHNQFIDSVQLSDHIAILLKRRNEIGVLEIKQAYGWNHRNRSTFEVPEPLDVSKKIPWDSTLLNVRMPAYAVLLHMYMQMRYYYPLGVNKSLDEIENIKKEGSFLLDRQIENEKYPPFMEEFLRAKNIYFWLKTLGINKKTDSVFNTFKSHYLNSKCLAPLQDEYNEWLAISGGSQAPDFSGITIGGKSISLGSLKGKIVYADVWATWCAPCIEEIPHAKKLQKQFEGSDQVVFLNISVDNDIEAWTRFISSDKDWSGLHINLQGESSDLFWKTYKIAAVPRYMLFDMEGKIVDANATRPSEGKIGEQIRSLFNKKI